MIFVSQYERDGYASKVGQAHCPSSLVRNGLRPEEFEPVTPNADAADLLYVGMMRDLKGVDLFLNALPLVLRQRGGPLRVVLVGDGPDLGRYKQMAKALMKSCGDDLSITFHDPMPAREAFSLGRTLVVPSRAESMPYIVLEALAAGVPLIAPRVGGIPEIYGDHAHLLIEPDDLTALSLAMAASIDTPVPSEQAERLKSRLASNYAAPVMARDVMAAYTAALSDTEQSRTPEHQQIRSKV
ncbi:MAG: glycosyltransferase family 4 protein, partial [Pseudomonadota bacterium]